MCYSFMETVQYDTVIYNMHITFGKLFTTLLFKSHDITIIPLHSTI